MAQVGGRDYVLRLAREESEVNDGVLGLLRTLAVGLLCFTVFAFASAHWIVRRALTPIETIRYRTQEISASRLSERLPIVNPDDEVGRLSITLNHLLDRLEIADSVEEWVRLHS